MGPESALLNKGIVNPAGANSMLGFDGVKLNAGQIDDKTIAAMMCPGGAPDKVASIPAALTCYAQKAGEQASATGGPENAKLWRNSLVGYLMMRSNQNCGVWFTYLERAGAINRGVFDVLSTVTGGAGSLVTGTASRILSGSAAISTGTGAAIDNALLHGLSEGLIIPRVLKVRQDKSAAIIAKFGEDATTWPMSVAVADVLDYHASCGIVAALQADTPGANFTAGISAMNNQMAQLTQLRAYANGAQPPTLDKIVANAVFLSNDNRVLKITDVTPNLQYIDLATQAKGTPTDKNGFLLLVDKGLYIKTLSN